MSAFPSGDLQVVAQPCARYLFNHRDAALSRVRLAELVVSSGGPQDPVVFEAPVYKTGDLPSHSYTELPSRRRHVDGYVLWRIGEAEWEDQKTVTSRAKLSERKIWGGAIFSEILVRREVRRIDTEPARPAVISGG